MANLIVVLVLLAIFSLAILKIVTEKRKGAKCVGCPYSTAADNKGGKGCSCH